MIELSARNPRVAETRRLVRQRGSRRQRSRFVVETPKLVLEALESSLAVVFVLVPEGSDVPAELIEAAADREVDVYRVASRVFDDIAEARAPQPALAVVEAPPLDLDHRFRGPGRMRVLVLVDVADPGNVGTLVRTAEASGCAGVVACGSTADVLSPKAVRASAGSMLRVPLAETDPERALTALTEAGFTTIATGLDGLAYDELETEEDRVAVVVGGEAHGLDPALGRSCTHTVTIPMAGRVESLNVATAGAVLAFELARRDRRRADREFSKGSATSRRG